MILAAGRGERLRPLTDTTPKPLLCVGGKPLIVWHLERLAAAGWREVVVNHAHLGEQIEAALGDGRACGLSIHYSPEPPGALETAGGIACALRRLGPEFWVVSGDIFAPGFGFDAAQAHDFVASDDDARIWLVPNPPYHAAGDFDLGAEQRVVRPPDGASRPLTYANIALMRARLVGAVTPGERAALGPLLFAAAAAGKLAGQRWDGRWHNVGTADEWRALQEPCA